MCNFHKFQSLKTKQIIHQNKANTSGFLKKVKLKKYKLQFFKNGGPNDVIFFKNRRENIPESCSNESDESLPYQ